MELYSQIVDETLTVRRVNIAAVHLKDEEDAAPEEAYEQMSLFADHAGKDRADEDEERGLRVQEAVVDLERRFGKGTVLKGMNLEEGAMTIARHNQIGGHRA